MFLLQKRLMKQVNTQQPRVSTAKSSVPPPKPPITKEQQQPWHKKSVSMKMRNANFKDGKKMISGQLVKYRKGGDIYAFRCIRDNFKFRQLKPLKQDHDIDTDDEQVCAATKNMFISLCQSLKNELFQDEQAKESTDTKVFK